MATAREQGLKQFRFQHGPFTKRFGSVVTGILITVLSISTHIAAPATTINKYSFVRIDSRGRCYFPFHLWFEDCSFSRYVPQTLRNFLAHCQAALLAPSSAPCVLFGSLSARVGALGCNDVFDPYWITPRDGPHCSRMLMNLPAVFVYLSSRCALGDLLPLFFRTDCLTLVGPTVCSEIGTSCGAQPNF